MDQRFCFFLIVALFLSGQVAAQSPGLLAPFTQRIMDDEDEIDDDDDDGDEDDDDDDDDDDDGDEDDEEKAEDEVRVHPTLYFVKLAAGTEGEEVEALLEELHSREVWYLPEIGLRLWEVRGFPYEGNSKEIVTQIDRHVLRARKKTKIDETLLNLGYRIPTPVNQLSTPCFDPWLPAIAPGTQPVKLSILDTGISWSLVSQEDSFPALGQIVSGYDYIDQDSFPNDTHGHGSQIAGVISQLLPSQEGHPLPFFLDIRKTHDSTGTGFLSNLIPAVVDAVKSGSHILNFSFSYLDDRSDSLCRPLDLAITYAEQNGVLVVASAGNQGIDNDRASLRSYPASFSHANILSVASLNCGGELSEFSGFGNESVDLGVIGESIPAYGVSASLHTGTSYATAMITAMAALLASHQAEFDYGKIKCSLINTAIYEEALKGKFMAQGRIDLVGALAQLEGACLVNGPGTTLPKPRGVGLNVYPNPVESIPVFVELRLTSPGPVIIRVYDRLGNTHFLGDYHVAPGIFRVQLPAVSLLPPGPFMIVVETREGHFHRKMIKS